NTSIFSQFTVKIENTVIFLKNITLVRENSVKENSENLSTNLKITDLLILKNFIYTKIFSE
ncbi:hypothetical protein EMPG_09232, partial [Blastomyces silverae]